MRNTIVKSLVVSSLVASSVYGFTPTKIDYIMYDYSKKIEWCKSHPNQYNTPVAQRVAKLVKERDRKIKAITDAQKAKKDRVEKARAEAIELIKLKKQVKELTNKLAKNDEMILFETNDNDNEGLAKIAKICNISEKPKRKIVHRGSKLICIMSKNNFIQWEYEKISTLEIEKKQLKSKLAKCKKDSNTTRTNKDSGFNNFKTTLNKRFLNKESNITQGGL
jgi:hypothetical protein